MFNAIAVSTDVIFACWAPSIASQHCGVFDQPLAFVAPGNFCLLSIRIAIGDHENVTFGAAGAIDAHFVAALTSA